MSDGHHHPVDDLLNDHVHHDHALEVVEEPLDPANQSLADALRASFRVLKLIMLVIVVLFVFSGVVKVDNKEVVVKSRFGRQVGQPLEPGLHFAWPYPIEATTRVPTAARTIEVDAFWLRLTESERGKNLNELNARQSGLDPSVDGALLTGDRAIMHLLLEAQYKIADANSYVKNVRDVDRLLRWVIQNSAVAEAARTTADGVWKRPGELAAAIHKRAQRRLDSIQSGIMLDSVSAAASHYPLQTKEDFLNVQDAENRMRQAVQEANKVWEEKVKGAAGPAWEPLRGLIARLDEVPDTEWQPILREIDEILTKDATGEASSRIQQARATSDRIVTETRSQVERFKAMLPAYQHNPELVRQRLKQGMLQQIFTQSGISRWVLPEGDRNIWLNKDPQEIRQAEIDRIRRKTEGAR